MTIRSRAFAGVMSLVGVFGAGACDPGSIAVDSEGLSQNRGALETVHLHMTWWGSPDRAARTNQVIAMFEALNPDIDITVEYYAATQSGAPGVAYWPTLNQYAATNALPDIMQHDYAYIAEWTQRGLLRPLDDLAADGTLDLSDVAATLVDGGRVGGSLMGVSLGLNTQAVVLDTDVFKQAHVRLPSDDWTWDDFQSIAHKLHRRTGIWGAGAGLHGYTPGWKAVYLSHGDWVFAADGKSLGYRDDSVWVDHWNMLLDLQAAGAIPTIAQEPVSANVDQLPMVTKRSAMEHVHSNQLVALWTAAGLTRNFKIMPLPRIDCGVSPVYMKPSQYFSVPATSLHPREAARFISFFTNDVAANKVLAGERGVPIASKVLAALKPTLGRETLESFDLIERATAYATKLPPVDPPAWTTILTTVFTPKVEKAVMNGETRPRPAVKLFRREANQLLAQ
jgi:multiple sugar transport system substrate-binding protein